MKKARFLISVLAVICIMIASVGLVACEPTEVIPPEPPAPPIVVEGPEAGVYYDVDGTDQYIILNAGNMFVLSVGEKPRAGVYTLENGALTLTFVKTSETEETASGTLTAEEITLTYGDKTIIFRKTASYTVRFEVNGGSAVNSQKVAIGKQAIEPKAPEKEGSLFLGWYADAAFTERYDFTKKVTSDTTIYAKWAERVVGQEEYVIGYDLGYTGEKIANTTTFGGKLHNVAEPAPRSGYKFGGWWISMYDDGTRLSYKYTDGMNFREDTTLYAMWIPESTGSKLASPVVNVTDKGASWDNIAGASTYKVKVEGPVGFTTVETSSPTPMYNIDFANSPAGDYTITVVAASTATDGDSEPTVRHYKNKALARVSKFNVIDNSVLVFTGVENAKEYYIRVNCGDELHNHSAHALGNVTSFDFVNCPMGEDGISFVVTAKANGYAPSDSRAFVYNRVLDKIEELKYDEATQVVSWDNVQDAAGYIVSVRSGETELIVDDIGKVNRFSLKEFAPTNGKLVVSVYPVAKGYNSPEATTLTCNKTVLATPQNIRIIGNILYWDEVADAAKYEITIGDKTITAEKPEEGELRYDLTEALGETPAEDYVLKIRAIDANGNGSLWSDAIDVRYNKMYATLAYSRNEVSWRHVIGAVRYEVRVNNGEAISVTDGKNSAKVTLTAENNEIAVRFISADAEGKETASDWATIEVEAYEIIFETNGGETIGSMFAALGDKIELPEAAKQHYTFMGWYNSPKGPIGNGMRYEEGYLTEAAPQVIFAFYEANRYGIKLEVDDGELEETFVDVPYDSEYILPVPTTTDGTVQFGGWFSAPNGTGTQYTDENGNSIKPFTDGGNMTLYAFWQNMLLDFSLTKVNNKEAYSVKSGPRINIVKSVTIPKEYRGIPVLMIAPSAFRNCDTLEEINFYNNMENVSSSNPFVGTRALKAIKVHNVEDNNRIRYWDKDGVLMDNGRLDEQVSGDRVPTISYVPTAKTGSFEIPKTVKEIGKSIFASRKLSEVIIPATVTKIAEEAFFGCENLNKITFTEPAADEEVKELTIGSRAFGACVQLREMTLPARLKSIELTRYELTSTSSGHTVTYLGDDLPDAFIRCNNLEKLSIADGNANYSSKNGILYSADETTIIYCPSAIKEKVEIPAGVTKIAAGAFLRCTNITELNIPNTVTEIGECAFYNCSEMTKITFEAGATGAIKPTKIGRYAFRQCFKVSEIIFEKGSQVTEIGEGAFYGCSGLQSLTIPATMEKICKNAFRGCSKLESVSFAEAENPRDVAFESGVFYECTKLTTFYLPKNVVKLPGVFGGCTSLQKVEVDPDNPNFTSVDGILYDKDITSLVFWPLGRGGNVTLPDTVKRIEDSVFQNNENITSITIGKNVNYIGERAFEKCKGLLSVTFEEGGTDDLSIGQYAFSECSGITQFNIPGRVNEVSDYMLYKMNNLESLTISEGVESIGQYGIYNNYALETVEIPASVTSIKEYAFAYNSKLKTIKFAPGSKLGAIEGYAFYKTGIESITIPASVKYIGYYAFVHTPYESDEDYDTPAYSPLKNVYFEANSQLEEIGPYAFYYAVGLEKITIPKSVKTLGAYSFAYCESLKELNFESGGKEALVIGALSQYKAYIGATSFKYDYGYAFVGCKELKNVEIPARAGEIGPYTFSQCSKLEKVTVEANANLRTIGTYAFYNCRALTSIFLPKSLGNGTVYSHPDRPGTTYDCPAIGVYAFYNCSSLSKVEFEEGGTAPLTIGKYAFSGCGELKELTIPGRLGVYEDKSKNEWVGIDDPAWVFQNCSKLTRIDIVPIEGGNITSVMQSYDGIIYNADFTELIFCPRGRLGEVKIIDSVKTIRKEAFRYCANITKITFGENSKLEEIGESAFSGCDGLGRELNAENEWVELENGYDFVIPSGVKTIGKNAFQNTKFITAITLPDKLEEFDSTIIADCKKLTDVNVSENNPKFKSIDGVLYDKNEQGEAKTLLFYPVTRTAEVYEAPNGITEIGDSAFKKNTFVKKVVLPEGLLKIDVYAFDGCTALEEINIPSTVTIIEDYAFRDCAELSKLEFAQGGKDPLSIGTCSTATSSYNRNSYVFRNCKSLGKVVLPERTVSLANSAFYEATGLTEISLPSTLTEIGEKAFYKCSSLVKLEFSANIKITALQDETFYYCTALERIALPSSLNELGEEVFRNCSSLQEVVWGANIETMGKGVFYDCVALKELDFGENSKLTVIPQQAFRNSGLVKVVIPATVFEIKAGSGTNAPFNGSKSLESITFADGSLVTKFEDYTFYNLPALKSLHFIANIESAGKNTFKDCKALTEVTFAADSKLTKFDNNMFENCSALKAIKLPATITTLGNYVFSGCTSLADIDVPAGLHTLGNFVFQNTGFKTFTVPSTWSNIGTNLFRSSVLLEEIKWDSPKTAIPSNTFYGCSALKTVNIPNATDYGESCFRETAIEKFTVPTTVTRLQNYLFGDCKQLKEITLHNNLTTIGTDTFNGCESLKEVVIPESVTSLNGARMFRACTSLEKVVLPENGKINTIATYMFYQCESLKEIKIPAGVKTISTSAFYGTGLLSLEIPDGVTKIDGSAFSGSDIKTITLPESLKEIGSSAFATSALESIVIPDSVEKINTGAFNGCKSLNSVMLPNNSKFVELTQNIFKDNYALKTVVIPDSVTKISNNAFENSGIEKIDIPESVATINNYAFRNTKLTTISIPEAVTTLNSWVLANNELLETIYLSSGLLRINDNAIINCANLKEIEIPSNVNFIGQNVFTDCPSLVEITTSESNPMFSSVDGVLFRVETGDTKVMELVAFPAAKTGSYTVPADVTAIKNKAFSRSNLSEIIVPDNVALGNSVFIDSKITKAVFGKNVTFGTAVFETSEISDVTLPEGLVEIPKQMFLNSLKLKSITIPASVEKIGDSAFSGSGLESLTVPASVKTIDKNAFKDCAALKSVTLIDGGEFGLTIGSNAFENCVALTSIAIPARARNEQSAVIGSYAFKGCTALATVTFATNPEQGAIAGAFNIGSYAFENCTALKSVEFPKELGTAKSVYSPIGSYAFRNCTALESVKFNFPEGVSYQLSGYAFDGCVSLKKFDCPKQISTLAGGVFQGTGLVEFYIHENIKDIQGSVFKNCASLKTVTISEKSEITALSTDLFSGCTALEGFVIPKTVVTINAGVFENCTSIKSIYIPANVTNLRGDVFKGWTAEQTIYIEISEDEVPSGWYEKWTEGCNAQIKWGVSPDQYPQP